MQKSAEVLVPRVGCILCLLPRAGSKRPPDPASDPNRTPKRIEVVGTKLRFPLDNTIAESSAQAQEAADTPESPSKRKAKGKGKNKGKKQKRKSRRSESEESESVEEPEDPFNESDYYWDVSKSRAGATAPVDDDSVVDSFLEYEPH